MVQSPTGKPVATPAPAKLQESREYPRTLVIDIPCEYRWEPIIIGGETQTDMAVNYTPVYREFFEHQTFHQVIRDAVFARFHNDQAIWDNGPSYVIREITPSLSNSPEAAEFVCTYVAKMKDHMRSTVGSAWSGNRFSLGCQAHAQTPVASTLPVNSTVSVRLEAVKMISDIEFFFGDDAMDAPRDFIKRFSVDLSLHPSGPWEGRTNENGTCYMWMVPHFTYHRANAVTGIRVANSAVRQNADERTIAAYKHRLFYDHTRSPVYMALEKNPNCKAKIIRFGDPTIPDEHPSLLHSTNNWSKVDYTRGFIKYFRRELDLVVTA